MLFNRRMPIFEGDVAGGLLIATRGSVAVFRPNARTHSTRQHCLTGEPLTSIFGSVQLSDSNRIRSAWVVGSLV